MNVSDDLKSKVVSDFNLVKDRALKLARSHKWRNDSVELLQMSFMSGSCLDWAIYDRKLDRFTKLRIAVGINNPLAKWFGDRYEAYFNQEDIRFVEFDLEDDNELSNL